MGSKSPPTPDYTAAANAQGAANQATAVTSNIMNNPNQVTPYGTSTWSPSTGNPDDRGTVTQTLSPDEQSKLNLSNQAQIYSLGQLNTALPSLLKSLGGFNLGPGAPSGTFDPAFNPGRSYQLDSGINTAPGLQTGLNFSGAPGIPDATNAADKQAQDAAYAQQTQYLDPQFAQQKQALTDNLANQGIQPGSQAYTQAMSDFANTQQRAYSDARSSSIAQGLQSYNTKFANQLAAQQQSVGQTAQQGQFANSARNQYINELLSNMSASNAALSQDYQTGQASTGMANAAREQNLNEQAQSQIIPINILNSLLSSSQVTAPQFQGFSQNTNITPAPIFQAAQAQYGAGANASNASNAKGGQMAGIGGALGSAAILM